MGEYVVKNYRVGMIQTNCYFMINTETKKGLIIDPGEQPDTLLRRMKADDFTPEAILLTHGHFDHVMGVEKIRQETGVPVYLHEAERTTLRDTIAQMFPQMNKSGLTVPVDVWMSGEPVLDLAGFQIKVYFTPGHTSGGVSYYFPNEGVLFSGDTLFAGSIGRTDFPGGSYSTLIRSVEEKLFPLPAKTKVYPGHEGETTIGHERSYNPFF